MLAAESTPGFVAKPVMTQGRDFNCTGTICYGIAANHATFVNLQGYINKFANAVGFSKIATDGFIGDGTVSAFRKVVAFVLKRAGSGATMKFGGLNASALTRQQLATYVNDVISTLDFWVGALGSPPNQANAAASVDAGPLMVNLPPISNPPSAGTATMNLPNAVLQPASITLPDLTKPSAGSFGPPQVFAPGGSSSRKVPVWAWIAGGVAVVGGVATAVALTRRQRRTA